MSAYASLWPLDPQVTFLNHGSFGACPIAVLEAQQRLRGQLERDPVRFFHREYPALLRSAREELAAFVGADPADLVFVANATGGVNTVLRSLRFQPGDELLTTNHVYGNCRVALEFVAARSCARVVTAKVPFPLSSADQVIAAVLERVTPRTRLALLDHVTSPTALVFPVERLVAELAERGIDTLVDGAHAPGMLDLNLEAMGAAYYTGNGHKWLCAPKGAAFLHVRCDRQADIYPLTISGGAAPAEDPARFQRAFDWTGTDDPTPHLCLAEAVRYLGSLLPGGWPELRARNHALTLQARDLLASTFGLPAPCPDEMLGSMATVPLPGDLSDGVGNLLFERHHIEIPIHSWGGGGFWARLSMHLYNELADIQRLLSALLEQRSA